MIERYSLPEMAAIWSTRHKTDTWLQVELLVCEGWAYEGVIPPDAMEKIRHASYNMQRMREIEQETHHDVISFLRSIQEQLGPEGRYIHLGLTSSDVLDTGLAAQLKEAGVLLTSSLAELVRVVEQAAVKYKYTLMAGRTHGIHAEPITFGLKLALWVDELRRGQQRLAAALEQVTVGKISGAVGTHATVPPQIEEFVCEQMGLGVEPVSSQVVNKVLLLCHTSAIPNCASESAGWPVCCAVLPLRRWRMWPSGTNAISVTLQPSVSSFLMPALCCIICYTPLLML